jgi:lysophospholipase L1-like esterase
MVDTMGENLDYLDKAMMVRYPTTKFKFYNYGIGSQNVVEANSRFNAPFVYKDRNYPPISQIKADIIIVSSFAYNPLSPYDINAYLAALKEVLNKSKAIGAKVYLLAEIAPLKTGFGKGVGGVNWSEEKTREQVSYILQNLDSAVNLAAQTSTPLINAYKKSQVDGKYGNKVYVGSHDGIHPSIEGEVFMADVIAETLKLP